MARAQVAYESKRKKAAVPPLKWHRRSGAVAGYQAKGARGSYLLRSRSPDRRRGVFPWTVTSGGVEIKVGGFDSKSEAQTFAAQYDAGLCGQPQTVVVAPQGLPPGVFKGTAAEDVSRASAKYIVSVMAALREMGVNQMEGGDASEMVKSSLDYVSRMEAAGVEPVTVAAVLLATKDHHHVHDCPGKHVELAEGAAEAPVGRYQLTYWIHGMPRVFPKTFNSRAEAEAMVEKMGAKSFTISAILSDSNAAEDRAGHYRVSYRDQTGVTWVDFISAPSSDVAAAIAQAAAKSSGHPAHSGFKVEAAEAGGAAESKKRLPQPPPGSGLFITHSSLTRDLWLVDGDTVVATSKDRGELLKNAADLIASRTEGAMEGRRPKG